MPCVLLWSEVLLVHSGRRQRHRKHRSAFRGVCRLYAAAVLLHHRLADAQAQPCSPSRPLRRVERIENAGQFSFGIPGPSS